MFGCPNLLRDGVDFALREEREDEDEVDEAAHDVEAPVLLAELDDVAQTDLQPPNTPVILERIDWWTGPPR